MIRMFLGSVNNIWRIGDGMLTSVSQINCIHCMYTCMIKAVSTKGLLITIIQQFKITPCRK